MKSLNLQKKDYVLGLILVVAFLFRFLFLEAKPPHFDEGIDGWWVDQLISQGFYPYDPTNYHGPFPFYFLFFSKLLFGRSLFAVRLPAALFGFGSVYILSRFKDYVGKTTAYVAAGFMAVSPAMTFYCRYTPHEVGLLFFSLLTTLGFLRWMDKRDVQSLWCLGLGFAGMATTKETFSIHVVCFALALLTLRLYENVFQVRSISPKGPKNLLVSRQYTSDQFYLVLFCSVLFILIFYTGFLVNWRGPYDFFRSFGFWIHTGTGENGHDKPFLYWTQLFSRYEWAGILGFLTTLYILWPRKGWNSREVHWLRLFSIYGLGTFLAYSLIPYKTPWCVMQLLWPFLITAGSSVDFLARNKTPLIGSIVVIALLSVGTIYSIELNFFKNTDEGEPYVYVQTFNEIMDYDAKLRALVREDVTYFHMPIKIYMEDTWPLAWLWGGEFTRISWMGNGGFENPDAPFVLADMSKRDRIELHMKKTYFVRVFRLRSAQGESVAYFDVDTFGRFFDPRSEKIFKPPVGVTP